MKLRYTVLLFLLMLPGRAHSQNNCSVMTFNQSTSNTSDKSGCGSFTSVYHYTTSWTFNAYCYQTQTSNTYYTATIALSATGSCQYAALQLKILDCPPSYSWTKSTPYYYSGGGYNSVSWQALNGIINGATTPCGYINGATAYAQCPEEGCLQIVQCTVCPKLPTNCCTCPCGSPIVLDVTGQGYNLTSAAQGVTFDLKGDGNLWQMAWTAKGSSNAFLALPGPDGLVHNGQQLFGTFTPQPASDSPNGFRALAVYDDPKNGGNGDGIIDARDAIFSSLRLWVDANHDGISQPDELYTLPALGINSISLSYKMSEKTDQYGNVFEYRAPLNPDKSTDAGKTAYDVFFVIQPPATTAKACPAPPATGKRPASSILKH